MERRKLLLDGRGELKKGPWKAEEDEVLIEHVNKYGPTHWSSIRSKGLLKRTGKSCRLRWVNKLRPNLKSGVKFSAEEERTVIDLQAKFGNKWAKIATYLQGRTDNDVKNFWSSRQKKLQRIHQTSAPKSNKKSRKINKQIPSLSDVNHFEDLVNSEAALNFKQKSRPLNICPTSSCIKSGPSLLAPQVQLSEPDLGMPLEGQEFVPRLGDSNFVDIFRHTSELTDLQRPNASLCFVSESSSRVVGYEEIDEPHTPDSFIDDFPWDIFEQIDSLPSPSQW